jgi:cell division protein FtsB
MRAKQVRQGVIVGVLAVASLWLISLIWGIAGKAQVAVRQEQAAKHEYEALEQRKATLEANIAELDTARGQDGAIREAFGVAKAGEEVIVVVPPATSTASSTESFWERWFGWL